MQKFNGTVTCSWHVPNLMDSRNDIHVTFLLPMLANRIELFHLASMSDSDPRKWVLQVFGALCPVPLPERAFVENEKKVVWRRKKKLRIKKKSKNGKKEKYEEMDCGGGSDGSEVWRRGDEGYESMKWVVGVGGGRHSVGVGWGLCLWTRKELDIDIEENILIRFSKEFSPTWPRNFFFWKKEYNNRI